MKNRVLFLITALCMLSGHSRAQNIPACIEKLNKKTSLSTTRFEQVVELKQNRKVYRFSVKSVRQCMDCDNGTIFYDADCNVVAYFMMGRGSNAFVADGYTAAEFGKSGYPNIRHGSKKSTLPDCISRAINQSDSLKQAGVIRLVQVRLKGELLYCFERKANKKLANCKDCSGTMVFYDADCKEAATFTPGGIAGAKSSKGYTISDYNTRETLKVLWQAK